MQVAGYSAVAISIPYTIGVVISESRDARDYLEGDGGGGGGGEVTMGRKIVGLVRWYWGEEDKIPYVEYLEKKSSKINSENLNKGDDNECECETSIENEDKTVWRLNQDRIEKDCLSDVKVSIDCDGMVQNDVVLKGNSTLGEQLHSANGNIAAAAAATSQNVFVSFQDDDVNTNVDDSVEENSLKDLADDMDSSISHEEALSVVKEIGNLSTIYSTWNYFPPEAIETNTKNRPSIGSTSSFHTTQLRIDELQYNIDELQKSLMDPSCTRSRDDMESEMREMKLEIASLKRERRMAKLKKLFPF